MFRHQNLGLVGLSLALFNCGLAHSALAQEPATAPSSGPDIAALARPFLEDLKSAEYSEVRCQLAPILAGDKRFIAFSRDDMFRTGDRLLAINGELLKSASVRALHDILVKYPPTATLSVRVLRAGSEIEVMAPCSDNQLYYAMLRAAVTAAAQDDAALCADRMADLGKHHAMSATWLNLALKCKVKAGRVSGAPMLEEYFDVYHEALLENGCSSEALQKARPSLQAAAQTLQKAGGRPLAEKLQQEYAAAVANVAPQLVGTVALKLYPDLPNPGIVQKAPTVIATQNGNVTNMTIAGQLAAKHPVGCVPLSTLDNTRTPPDLYLGVSACINRDDYSTAAGLFALAGIESRFDAERVADKSAGQAGQVLIMGTFNAIPDEKRQQFQKTVAGMNADPKAMALICRAIEKIGYPTYYPEYMVLHGIQAFTAKPGDATLVADFNAPVTWNFLLTNYLSCHDVPAAPQPVATAAKNEARSTNPNPMPPGLYQVRSTQAPDLKDEEPLRLCFTPSMIAANNPVPEAGQCERLDIVRTDNTTHVNFSCAKDGIGAKGQIVETVEGNRRYSVIDIATTTDHAEHPLHLVTEMIFLGPDCNAAYPDLPARAPKAPAPAIGSTNPDPAGATVTPAPTPIVAAPPAPAVKSIPSSELTPDGWPIPPDKHLVPIKALPAHDEVILEVRNKNSNITPPNEIGVFNLTRHTESKWDVLSTALREWPANQFGAQADWAPRAGKFLYATTSSAHLVSKDGTTTELHLQMPGTLAPFDGMTAYALAPDAKHIAYLLYARDGSDRQEDKNGKLYMDLMTQSTEGSSPISIWRDGFVIRPAWRPDGAAIAHTDSEHNLVVSDLSGRTLWSFHPGPPSQNGSIADYIAEIRWNPSGKQLAFLMGSPIPQIYVINSDGTAMKAIEFKNALGTDREPSIRSFAWSPDGRRFAIRAEADSKCNNAALGFKFETGRFPCIYSRNLFTVNADGSHLIKVTSNPDYDSGDLFWVQ